MLCFSRRTQRTSTEGIWVDHGFRGDSGLVYGRQPGNREAEGEVRKKKGQEKKTHAGGAVARRSVQAGALRQTDVAVGGTW
jgi:hypothetical protein